MSLDACSDHHKAVMRQLMGGPEQIANLYPVKNLHSFNVGWEGRVGWGGWTMGELTESRHLLAQYAGEKRATDEMSHIYIY